MLRTINITQAILVLSGWVKRGSGLRRHNCPDKNSLEEKQKQHDCHQGYPHRQSQATAWGVDTHSTSWKRSLLDLEVRKEKQTTCGRDVNLSVQIPCHNTAQGNMQVITTLKREGNLVLSCTWLTRKMHAISHQVGDDGTVKICREEKLCIYRIRKFKSKSAKYRLGKCKSSYENHGRPIKPRGVYSSSNVIKHSKHLQELGMTWGLWSERAGLHPIVCVEPPQELNNSTIIFLTLFC